MVHISSVVDIIRSW